MSRAAAGWTGRLKPRWRCGTGLVLAIFLTAWTTFTLTIYVARYLMTGIVIASPITVIAPLWVCDGWLKSREHAIE